MNEKTKLCQCGCGKYFAPKTPRHKIVDPSHRRKRYPRTKAALALRIPLGTTLPCGCGCGESFIMASSSQRYISGHGRAVEAKREKERIAAKPTKAEQAESLIRAQERSPLSCPHRCIRACNHLRFGGSKRECMTQRAKALCPLGFAVK